MSIDSQLDSQSRREALEKMFKGSLAAGSMSVLPLAQADEAAFTDDERALLAAVACPLFPHPSRDKSHYRAVSAAL